jgi:hypothetical protein
MFVEGEIFQVWLVDCLSAAKIIWTRNIRQASGSEKKDSLVCGSSNVRNVAEQRMLHSVAVETNCRNRMDTRRTLTHTWSEVSSAAVYKLLSHGFSFFESKD